MAINTLEDVVSKFNTTPFLFIGSGITRRYYNLPDWESLLRIFATRINEDPFAYSSYENKARVLNSKVGLYPKIAELIESDFNNLWFSAPSKRHLNKYYLDLVSKGSSPFKAEIAMYIKENSHIVSDYESEIKNFHNLSKKSLSGVITTNYDSFLENTLDEYKAYVGQEELIFSSIQGIAEIYKIHGSVENPDSIVINSTDYNVFDEKSPYLAAKLMTIFMEYPVVFLGYSLNDSNVQKIIKSIVDCLSPENLSKLQERFIFVEYIPNMTGADVSSHTMVIGDKILYMTKISCSNFDLIYNALSIKKAELPVKLLRKFKQELYTYTISNSPTAKLKVVNIDDGRLDDDEMVMAIGGMLRAAELRMIILVDGFIMTNCILAASKLHPEVLSYAIFGHQGDETGHKLVLDAMKVRPLLNLGLRLGEGTGAICAYPIVVSSVNMMNEMDNFAHASITKYF